MQNGHNPFGGLKAHFLTIDRRHENWTDERRTGTE